MMRKLWKRIAIEAFAVLGLAGDVLLMCSLVGKSCVPALLLGLVLAAYCALVFMIALRSGRMRQARLITLRHESGDAVLLSQETLDHLVASAIGQPEGVSDVRVITGYQDESVEVMIDVSVSSNINIPVTTARMQEAVRRQLGEVNGLALSGVSVKISTIKVPGEGEEMVPPQAAEPVQELVAEEPVMEEPAEEEKAEEAAAEESASEEPVQESAMREPAEVEDESFGENSDPENDNTAE